MTTDTIDTAELDAGAFEVACETYDDIYEAEYLTTGMTDNKVAALRAAIAAYLEATRSTQQGLKEAETGWQTFDFRQHLQRQRDWSERTFGPNARTLGVIDHIRKELAEIEADPTDVKEWIDVVILGLDGAWRAGYSPEAIIEALVAKQTRNEGRIWPDWRTLPADKAIEHTNKGDDAPAPPESQNAMSGVPDGLTANNWRWMVENILKDVERTCGPGPMLDAVKARLAPTSQTDTSITGGVVDAKPFGWAWNASGEWHVVTQQEVENPEQYARRFGHPVVPLYALSTQQGFKDGLEAAAKWLLEYGHTDLVDGQIGFNAPDSDWSLTLSEIVACIRAIPAPSVEPVALSAAEYACYEWPGEDQAAIRGAYVRGAVDYAYPQRADEGGSRDAGLEEAARLVEGWSTAINSKQFDGFPKTIKPAITTMVAERDIAIGAAIRTLLNGQPSSSLNAAQRALTAWREFVNNLPQGTKITEKIQVLAMDAALSAAREEAKEPRNG